MIVLVLRAALLSTDPLGPIAEAASAALAAGVLCQVASDLLPRRAGALAGGAAAVIAAFLALLMGPLSAGAVGVAAVGFLALDRLPRAYPPALRGAALAGAGLMDPAVGLAACGGYSWYAPRGWDSLLAWAIGALAGSIAAVDASMAARGSFVILASAAGALLAPSLARVRLRQPGRAFLFTLAGLMPAATLVAVVVVSEPREDGLAPWAALGAGAIALVLGAAAGLALLGMTVLLSTRTAARGAAVGTGLAAVGGAAILGLDAAAMLALPLALLFGVGARFAARAASGPTSFLRDLPRQGPPTDQT